MDGMHGFDISLHVHVRDGKVGGAWLTVSIVNIKLCTKCGILFSIAGYMGIHI